MAKPLMHNGKAFTNADSWRTAKATQSVKPMASEVGDGKVAPEEGGEESPESVVAAHGPANEVNITHDHAMGMHSVHSMHADGHEHQSEHGSVEEAHEHAKNLAMDDANNERPEGEEEDGWDE
jgi:hypothetical protein